MTTTGQCGFVVVVPIEPPSRETIDRVKKRLETLGNPAGEPARQGLDAAGRVHFMSMSVIQDEESVDPPLLLLEVEGDGAQADLIDALIEYAGEFLVPLFAIACGVQSRADLKSCLLRGAAVGRPNPIPWPGAVIGLPFQGTPGLTVMRIREDSRIETVARRTVEDLAASPGGRNLSALDYLTRVRAELGLPEPQPSPIARPRELNGPSRAHRACRKPSWRSADRRDRVGRRSSRSASQSPPWPWRSSIGTTTGGSCRPDGPS